jgi:hypothetical protein
MTSLVVTTGGLEDGDFVRLAPALDLTAREAEWIADNVAFADLPKSEIG